LRWYSAKNLALTNGASVTSWPDLSPNADTAGISGSGGIFSTTGANGFPGVVYNGASARANKFTRVTTVQTVIVVAMMTSPQANDFASLLGDTTSFDIAGPQKSKPFLIDVVSQQLPPRFFPARMNGINAGVLGQMIRPSSLTITAFRSTSGNPISLSYISQERVNARTVTGTYSEVILYNRILSDAEISGIEQYLATQYAITLGTNPTYGAKGNALFCGDSRTFGQGSTGGNNYPNQLAPLLGGAGENLAVTNLGISGTSALQWLPVGQGGLNYFETQLVNPFSHLNNTIVNVFHSWLGFNDYQLDNNVTPATVVARNQALWAQMRADIAAIGGTLKIIAYNEPDAVPGSGAAAYPAWRASYNSLMLAASGYDYMVDLGANPTIGPDGSSSNTTYYNADKIHFTNAGYLVIANASAPAYAALGL